MLLQVNFQRGIYLFVPSSCRSSDRQQTSGRWLYRICNIAIGRGGAIHCTVRNPIGTLSRKIFGSRKLG